ncbi:hypothetical protein [Methanopyrus sp.]
MIKRVPPYAVAVVIICTLIGSQPAHSEKAPIPKPPKLEGGEEKKEAVKRGGVAIEKFRVVNVDYRRKIVQLAPPYKPKPVLQVKVPPRAVRQLQPGTVVEVHQQGNKTIIRTTNGTVEGYRVTTGIGPSGTTSSSSLKAGSASTVPSRASAGAGTHKTTVNAKISLSKSKKTSKSKKENKSERGGKEKNRSKEKTNVNGSKGSGSSGIELQREARGEGSSGWMPYLVVLALVGAATGGMWLVKQRRSTTWEWE